VAVLIAFLKRWRRLVAALVIPGGSGHDRFLSLP
jgi:hypothetical protein